MNQPPGLISVEQAMEQAQELFRAGRTEEAIARYERIIAALPQFADARGALALVHWSLNLPAEAELQARSALSIDPECGAAHCALGLLHFNRHKLAEALPQLERALKSRPDLIAALNYAGMCADRLGDVAKALDYYDTALRLQPDHPHVHFNRALAWLSLGRFDGGWQEYEWRWLTGQVARPAIPRPRWNGADLSGRRILVHSEQGIGDTLQFVRLLPLLKECGAHVTFACLKQLQPLLRRTDGIDDWFPIDEPAPITFEIYTPLGSIPGWLRIDEPTIPRTIPYVFPAPERVERWRPRIAAMSGFKVGLCWQGSRTFVGDYFRSIPLKHFAPLAQVEGVRLVSLQKGYGEEQLSAFQSQFPVTVLENLDEEGGAMMDTAAVMQHLDLIITSDTAMAHLAGSMGIPVWVALPFTADWRWLRRRSDCPWYPSMRLFRQPVPGDWGAVFAEIAAALRLRVAGKLPPISQVVPAPSAAVPVSPGELFDKITILRIKSERISDPAKLANVRRELALLEAVQAESYPMTPELSQLVAEVKAVNEQLWEIEDAIRVCERRHDFGPQFVELARSVYLTNDRRAQIKRHISDLFGSPIAEEKSYAN